MKFFNIDRNEKENLTKYLLMQSKTALINDHIERKRRTNVAVAIVHCLQLIRLYPFFEFKQVFLLIFMTSSSSIILFFSSFLFFSVSNKHLFAHIVQSNSMRSTPIDNVFFIGLIRFFFQVYLDRQT